MGQNDLKQYFLEQITNGKCVIKVSNGKSKYRMKRGSFKTSDHLKNTKTLHFKKQTGNRYIFSDGKIESEILLDDSNNIKLHFHVDNGFNRFSLTFKTFEDEHIYGCGEQYTILDLKGKTVPIWVSEHHKVSSIARKLIRMRVLGPQPDKVSKYKNHQTYAPFPIFISSKNYAFYCHDESYGKLSFGKDYVTMSFRDIPHSISLLTANSQKELMEKISNLVSISPKLPDWVNDGIILAVQGGTDIVREKYRLAKEKGIKVSAIWSQDWCGNVVTSFGYQVYWNWSADENLYHDLKALIKELNDDGVRFLGYINTFLKEDSPLYNEAKDLNVLIRHRNGDIYHIQSTTFNAGIVDLTNPTGYEWYKDIIKHNMIEYGLSGFMADFGEYLPTDSIVYGGTSTVLHNKWPTLWAKCCRDAIIESGKEDEIFMFSRAAFSTTVKYTNSIWNGDQHVDFSDEYGLGSVIPASLSLSCSGVGVIHSDIGGYTTMLWMRRDAELFNRWSEMNIFTPIYRTHEGNRPKDNVQFDDEDVVYELAENSQIFYELKEYRVHTENEYQTYGTPMIRPLFAHYEDEESRMNKREYMFGSDILVSPVYRANEQEHTVYLPDGKWIQFFTGKAFTKGTYTLPSPIGLPIAFYKDDSEYKELFETITNKHKKGE